MQPSNQIIEQTKKWVEQVVIGCNFCPFASKPFKDKAIHYRVEAAGELSEALQLFIRECIRLDEDPSVETSLLIFPDSFGQFDDYLDLVSLAEKLLKKEGYEGIYQVAGFHPQYRFAGSPVSDAANYTNRSPYPMLHLLREDSIESVLKRYPNPENIPERNIAFAREKGVEYMKNLRDNCF